MLKSTTALHRIIFIFTLSCTALPLHAETIRYVSDSLTIPMRTGTSNRHKIIKFLTSGTELKVMEQSEDGLYTHVRLDEDKEGWVETSQLMDEPSARQKLDELEKDMSTMGEKTGSLKKQIIDLKSQLKQSQNESNQLEQKNQSLTNELEKLRESAANPIAVAERNSVLENQIDDMQQTNQTLLRENAVLNDRNIKEWFMIGGGGSLISLFFGLIIPRISWRKKDSWGGSF